MIIIQIITGIGVLLCFIGIHVLYNTVISELKEELRSLRSKVINSKIAHENNNNLYRELMSKNKKNEEKLSIAIRSLISHDNSIQDLNLSTHPLFCHKVVVKEILSEEKDKTEFDLIELRQSNLEEYDNLKEKAITRLKEKFKTDNGRNSRKYV